VAHDVAITNLTASPTQVNVGASVTVTVTVVNQGNFTEKTTVTVKYDGTVIRTISVENLEKGQTRTLSFSWSTTGVNPDTYTLFANASVVEDETDTADNIFTGVTVTINRSSSSISLSAGKTTITVGETVTLSGSITPARAEATVSIFYRLSGSETWNSLTTVETDTDSQYSFDWTPTATGSYEVKASWTGNATLQGDESDIQTITVEEAPPPVSIPIELLAGAIVIIIVIAAALVYFFKIRKPTPK